ncbi:MAG: threonylcarbamoyl-AMP synthase [Armatimonadetes bacterium]|nr:threonylcarbamoyl-AMP synthase [Armatimonadota bacterium]
MESSASSSQSHGETGGPVIIRPRNRVLLTTAEADLCGEAFKRGGLIAFPTDTVYGVGADAGNPEAIARLFAAKRRPPTKPLPVLIGSPFGLYQCCPLPPGPPDMALALAYRFWPGPLTIVTTRSHRVCPEAVAGGGTVGVRMPDLALACQLLDAVPGLMAVTSANLSGEESTVSPEEVLRTLGPSLDVLIDFHVPASGLPSTVLDLTTSPPRLLRQGAVTPEQLASVIGDVAGP